MKGYFYKSKESFVTEIHVLSKANISKETIFNDKYSYYNIKNYKENNNSSINVYDNKKKMEKINHYLSIINKFLKGPLNISFQWISEDLLEVIKRVPFIT